MCECIVISRHPRTYEFSAPRVDRSRQHYNSQARTACRADLSTARPVDQPPLEVGGPVATDTVGEFGVAHPFSASTILCDSQGRDEEGLPRLPGGPTDRQDEFANGISNRTESAFQTLDGHGLLARDKCMGLCTLNPSKNQASGKPAAICIKGRFSVII